MGRFCCCSSRGSSPRTHGTDFQYHMMMRSPALKKYEVHQPTLLMNSSVSIDEHLRCKSRTITAVNRLKFFLRMVLVQNVVAILMQLVFFESMFINIRSDAVVWDDWYHEDHVNV